VEPHFSTNQSGGYVSKHPANHQLPDRLAAVALIDAKTAAATGGISVSQWHQDVVDGKAPQPAIREHRYTRWRLADVEAYWTARAAAGLDAEYSERVTARCRRAAIGSLRARKAKAAAKAASDSAPNHDER
jgi:predicted DNA-binding transcriptional regulator AlpA